MTINTDNSSVVDNALDDDLKEGIFPALPTKVKIPSSREFKPWHKPRKHFIRIHQWQEEIRKLIKDINFDGRPLRYISLPGDDFLDVRTLYELCESSNLPLRFLGFNDMVSTKIEDTMIDPTINEIVNLDLVDERSLLTPDRFENLYLSESMASKYVDDTGPFDILNLDLCQSFSTPRQRKSLASSPTTYDALLSLIQRQTSRRTEPWLFFLTTRCAPENVDQNDIVKFWGCIENNISSCQEFARLFNQLVSGRSRDELIFPNDNKAEQTLDFTNTYCIGLGKWLLQTAKSGDPKWKVQMLKSYHYRVRYPYDMLSIAFRFERITILPYDVSGLSMVSGLTMDNHNMETTEALELIRTTSELHDADLILQRNQSLRDEMVIRQAELLEKAGYSQEHYFEWLDSNGLL